MISSLTQRQEPQSSPAICADAAIRLQLARKTTSSALRALSCYGLTSTIVLLGVVFGYHFIDVDIRAGRSKGSLASAFARHDGVWYKGIVSEGYSYNREKNSPVAFFLLYPLLAASLMRLTGFGPEPALLIISHACLAAAFVLAGLYVRARFVARHPDIESYVLLSMGLMPSTLFFRMTYSESLFILLTILALLSMVQRSTPGAEHHKDGGGS